MKEKQLDALLENINYEISLLSNMSAFIKQEFKDVSWAGFYLNQDEQLILGPFQGLVACTIIPFDKGVCGACAKNLTTLRVANVHEFSGHIACDSASNSEIVLPIVIDDSLYGVLDLDSTNFNRFQEDDQLMLEKLVNILIKHLKRIKNNKTILKTVSFNCLKIDIINYITKIKLTFFIKFMTTLRTSNSDFSMSSRNSNSLFTLRT